MGAACMLWLEKGEHIRGVLQKVPGLEERGLG
jgi:hypothetical protein